MVYHCGEYHFGGGNWILASGRRRHRVAVIVSTTTKLFVHFFSVYIPLDIPNLVVVIAEEVLWWYTIAGSIILVVETLFWLRDVAAIASPSSCQHPLFLRLYPLGYPKFGLVVVIAEGVLLNRGKSDERLCHIEPKSLEVRYLQHLCSVHQV